MHVMITGGAGMTSRCLFDHLAGAQAYDVITRYALLATSATPLRRSERCDEP